MDLSAEFDTVDGGGKNTLAVDLQPSRGMWKM
jgi:hypothetical protein